MEIQCGYLQTRRNTAIIFIYPLSEAPKTIRKTFEHSTEVFLEAGDFYHRNKDKLLIEIFARDGSDPYARTLDYIAVLEGLTKCNALLANVTCGAVAYAMGRHTEYEFVDVRKIREGSNH